MGDSTNTLEYGKVLLFVQGDFTIAHGGGIADSGRAIPTLLLLFPPGKRPDGASLRGALENAPGIVISLDHCDEISPMSSGPWFEIIVSGLTFELRGFRSKTADADLANALVERVSTPDNLAEFGNLDGLVLHVSPHLADGAMATPILRGLCVAASAIAAQLDTAAGYGWPEAGSLFAPERFRTLTEGWAWDGPLPIDFFIRFRSELDLGIASRGLAAFIGQELRLEPELVEDRSTAERLGQRLAAQLIPTGPLKDTQHFAMPDGRNLRLEPSKNGRFVRAFLR